MFYLSTISFLSCKEDIKLIVILCCHLVQSCQLIWGRIKAKSYLLGTNEVKMVTTKDNDSSKTDGAVKKTDVTKIDSCLRYLLGIYHELRYQL